MKGRANRKKIRFRLLMSMLALATFLVAGMQLANSAELQQTMCEEMEAPPGTPATEGPAEKTAGVPEGPASMRVYIDPQTGKIGTPPAGGPPAQVPPSFSTSHKGLVETPSPTPGGGTMVDLRGRFRSPLIATQDSEGNLSIQHKIPSACEKK
jgi:hypothetical protein